jgi:methionine sulfoxide reductase heme-binding subunit
MNTKQFLKYFFIILIFAILGFTAWAWFNISPREIKGIGKIMGTISALLFCLVITPGIVRRLKIQPLQNLASHIMYCRAQVGLSMFFAGLSHYVHAVIIFATKYGKTIEPKSYFIFGLLALFLSFWLALTSNMFSKRLLKKNWQKLHSLVYIIVWLIFIHTALIEISPISFLLLIFAILETYSLVKVKMDKKIV